MKVRIFAMKQDRMHYKVVLFVFCFCALPILCLPDHSRGATKAKATARIDSLDLHAKASVDSRIVKTLSKGEAVSVSYELIGNEGTWCAVAEEGQSSVAGYVLCKHLNREASVQKYQDSGLRTVAVASTIAAKEESVTSTKKATRLASEVKVLLYFADWCPYCRKARECLKSLGVNLIEYDIEKDDAKREEMMQKGGTGGVPFIDIEGIILKGYSEESIKRAVAKRQGM